MVRTAFALSLTLAAAQAQMCAPIGGFQLSVRRAAGSEPRPVRQMNALRPGEQLVYRPGTLPAEIRKSARIAVVLAPADGGMPRVLDVEEAAQPAEWNLEFRVAVVGVVFGPHGLNRKKISTMLVKDRTLVTQLADYAEQTARVEELVTLLAAAERDPSPGRSLDAALAGFAARHGASVSKLDRNAPTDQQAMALIRAVNPALGAYDPLAPQSSARMQQSAGLAASVAGLFFGTNIGLAAGSAALAQNLRTLMFPATDFRSALAQSAPAGELTLCARRETHKSRTRLAYLWAHRLPDAGPPAIALENAAHLPLGVKSVKAVKISAADARLLDRAREWALTDAGGREHPVAVKPLASSLEIDLTGADVPPGVYQLAAKWDWEAFRVTGEVQVHKLGDLQAAAPTPESADRLIAGTGTVKLELTGADFQFVEKAAFRGQPAEFKRYADRLEVTVDTQDVKPGRYRLALAQPDGKVSEIGVRVLPPHPVLEGLPIFVNLGEERQKVALRGSGLERIERVEAPGAHLELAPGSGNREAVLRLGPEAKKGDRLPLRLRVEGVSREIEIPAAMEVVGPRPRLAGVTPSLPEELGVALQEGDLPAGSVATFSIRVEQLEAPPVLRVECEQAAGTIAALSLRPGVKQARARLDSAAADLLFLSLDPGAVGRPGCRLQARVSSEPVGASDAAALGRVIRLPRIESFRLTEEKLDDSVYAAILTGQDLDTIEKTGWDAGEGLPVTDLPRAAAGEGTRQTLRIALRWPSPAPHAPLYVWLRGESEGRATRVRY